jgi:hypothetical protein
VALRIVLLLLALISPGLTALAYLDPPDPPWISGYWDDDDFDSAIDAILNACAVEPGSLDVFGLQWTLVSRIVALAINTSAPSVETADAPRGPPAAWLSTA